MNKVSKINQNTHGHHVNSALFEMALSEIVSRHNRCHHVLQLLTATCALYLLFTCGLFAFAIVWQSNPLPTLLSGKALSATLCLLYGIRIFRRKFALDNESSLCTRMNRTLACCGFDLAYDIHSGRLYSKEKRGKRDSVALYESVT